MTQVQDVFSLNIPYIVIGSIVLAVAFKFVCEVGTWFANKFGIELKSVKQKKEDHELLLKTVNRVEEIDKIYSEHDRVLEEKLENLTHMFIDKQIDDIRCEILDFASSISNGQQCNNKEQFDHIIEIHKKYERILEENGLTNGRVTLSMEVVNDIYKEKLKNGF